MKDIVCKAAVCCVVTSLMFASQNVHTSAAAYEVEVPVAGMSVTLNNYFAKSSGWNKSVKSGLANPVVGSGSGETTPDEETVPTEETTPAEETTTQESSEFDNIAVSRCYDYVNVRTEPNTESEIVGKIYDGCAATILERVDDWYKIESGNVEGYIKAEYFVTGKDAETLAAELATTYAIVNTTTLRVRADADINSDCVTMVPLGEEFVVMEEKDGWAKIEIDASTSGWVSLEYLDTRVEFDKAISVEEEEAKLAEQEAARVRAEEARARADEEARRAREEAQRLAEQRAKEEADRQAAAAAQQQAETQAPASPADEAAPTEEGPASPADEVAEPLSPLDEEPAEEAPPSATEVAAEETPVAASNETLREAIVAYALQFVGRPYVYGGNSLTNGTDCSGFVKLIYQDFGYNITRRASTQYNDGRRISIDEIQPGDLIFYGNGEVDHVTMYIGNGQVVHASTARTGIKISSVNYRTIYGAVSIID